MSDETNPAKAYALQQSGLSWDNRDKWNDAQRRQYLALYAEFRAANAVTDADRAAAANYAAAATAPAEEFSYWDATLDALEESVAELPGRINTGINMTVPVWLRWLVGLVLVAWILSVLRPYLPSPKKGSN